MLPFHRNHLGGNFTTVSQKSSMDCTTVEKLLQVHRLGNVAVGVEVVGLQDVLLGLGHRQDHHRNPPQFRVVL